MLDDVENLDEDIVLRAEEIFRDSGPASFEDDLGDKAEFMAAVAALRAGGVDELAFYNWGHLRPANLSWIKDALGVSA